MIDKNPRRNKELKKALAEESLARKTLNLSIPETLRYNARSTAERTNIRLKDEFGACKIRVRGYAKVACHLLFGVLTLAADQLMQLVTSHRCMEVKEKVLDCAPSAGRWVCFLKRRGFFTQLQD